MGSFFDRLMHRQPKSAVQAKDRLKLVLSHDRADLPPGVLEELKDEIVDIISRRIEIDPGAVRIQMTHDGREQRLIADIPLRPSRKRRMG
ncbi:MAG: cell division topological specificity factor MinE [Anaerolineales bacterium]|nr:cell division topological specificity factor MinE [Anaerolineales bacterium]